MDKLVTGPKEAKDNPEPHLQQTVRGVMMETYTSCPGNSYMDHLQYLGFV